jgi:hypothetical protein
LLSPPPQIHRHFILNQADLIKDERCWLEFDKVGGLGVWEMGGLCSSHHRRHPLKFNRHSIVKQADLMKDGSWWWAFDEMSVSEVGRWVVYVVLTHVTTG